MRSSMPGHLTLPERAGNAGSRSVFDGVGERFGEGLNKALPDVLTFMSDLLVSNPPLGGVWGGRPDSWVLDVTVRTDTFFGVGRGLRGLSCV